ncbi:Nuclear polyadenylated RNA-binding protein-like protein [Emericellopsis cladophorae]|uniref:Nuclear polyadenylated RNA-binding protein-like protein n=1 Tax=Emericellopsis cladophorae TaxID=2686198 RepID=A0A9P9Y9B3_9HYPO|nr:Nuclear polyadenylated RNA-binding protein-like protein [Emericellopsis cladophorae]KAI6785846.1 Nuclear polyadenylated RNA-binding protein-like protein [Emericellopsis cladophorae]
MPVEVALNTPLADALTAAVQPKLMEVGWAGDSNDSALAEYIILMLVNGKDQNQIAAELSGELLNLPPEDPTSHDFARWLFEQLAQLNAQINGQPEAADSNGADAADGGAPSNEMDTDMGAHDGPGFSAPTGPRALREGNLRGGREKRMLGHVSKAMDRTGDQALHRVRGRGGIDTHSRNGLRGGAMRGGRGNNRMNNIQHGMATGMGGPNMMMGAAPGMDVYALLEQQNQMMMQLQQTIMSNNSSSGGHRGRGGKFDRGNRRGRGGHGQHHHSTHEQANAEGGEAGDVDMSGEKREPPNPEETVCKYNLNCTNRECKFAHQSPAAPRGAQIDVSDVCSFGAACKNFKCVGRHPSPATKLAHQSEQDCKFWPNCSNNRCPFRHPSMPLCRNGADCTTADCKFTHVKTKCKFNPCKNPKCPFQHDEGQQGGFKDMVWTPGGDKDVSDRKFVEDGGNPELVKPEGNAMEDDSGAKDAEVIT